MLLKSPKLPGANFSAARQFDPRSSIDIASIALARSHVSLSSGDEVPHILTRNSRPRSGEFLITSAKRLFQQHRSFASDAIEPSDQLMSAMPQKYLQPDHSLCGAASANISLPKLAFASWRSGAVAAANVSCSAELSSAISPRCARMIFSESFFSGECRSRWNTRG